MNKIFPPNLLPLHKRNNIAFLYGRGPYLFGADGRRYLDFVSGIAVNSLGHCHPQLVGAIKSQVEKYLLVGNMYRVPEQESLAERLCTSSFANAIFFCNSGAEAIEGAIKMARRTHFCEGNVHKNRIITMEHAFHGRTIGALAATGNPKYMEGFAPNLDGFDQVELSLGAIEAAIGKTTAAILLEPILAEGGLHVVSNELFSGIRDLCDSHDLLLMVDEVQTGIGRSGKLFAYEWTGVKPDIMTLAKGLGGGVPIGAVAVTDRVAQHMQPGTHGSTFSGNSLAIAAGNAVFDVMFAPGFLAAVERVSAHMFARGQSMVSEFPDLFEEVRGRGLLFGFKCRVPNAELVAAALEEGLLCHVAGDNVLRFLPPLIINESHVDEAFVILGKVASQYNVKQ
jgi:acetylornithine/N-succinyldiaminopimelate aminotransferase